MVEIIITMKNSMRKIGSLSGAAARTGKLKEKERRNDEDIKRQGIGGFQKNKQNRNQIQKYRLQRS